MADLWNVRGVGKTHREKAKKLAKAAGLSIGDWLERVIDGADRTVIDGQFAEVPEKIPEPVASPPRVVPMKKYKFRLGTDKPARASKKKTKTCAHGTPVDDHCWQCGGKAVAS